MYKHILIPTDGSKLSDNAAENAVELAKALQAEITAIHVLPTKVGVIYGEMAWLDERVDAQMRETATGYLDRIEKAAKQSGVKFSKVLKQNDMVWRTILDVAKEKNCDLIVMAAHGRQGLEAALLGGETNRVLAHSTIPILIHRGK